MKSTNNFIIEHTKIIGGAIMAVGVMVLAFGVLYCYHPEIIWVLNLSN